MGKKKVKEPDPMGRYGHKTLIFVTIVFALIGHWGYQYWKTSRLYSPLSAPKAVLYQDNKADDLQRLWGSYRYIYIY